MVRAKNLTDKQKRFYEYCAGGIAPVDAARRAGYRDAMREARRLMERVEPISLERSPATEQKTEEEKPVAQKQEILGFLTEMMREDDDPRMRMKAAELLGKQAKLFGKEAKQEEGNHIIIVDDIS